MRYGLNRLVCAGLALTVLYVLQGGHHNVGVATYDVPRPVLTPRDILVELLQEVRVPAAPKKKSGKKRAVNQRAVNVSTCCENDAIMPNSKEIFLRSLSRRCAYLPHPAIISSFNF